MSKESWFTAKAIFLHASIKENAVPKYEERVVLLKAESEKEAIKAATKDAKRYVKNENGVQFVGVTDMWELHDNVRPGNGTEIFVSMTPSKLPPDEYIEAFYPDAPEDCEAIGEKHSWHNLDGKKSACYNCRTIRKGQLW